METTIVYWGYIGIMDKNMETAIVEAVALVDSVLGPSGRAHESPT